MGGDGKSHGMGGSAAKSTRMEHSRSAWTARTMGGRHKQGPPHGRTRGSRGGVHLPRQPPLGVETRSVTPPPPLQENLRRVRALPSGVRSITRNRNRRCRRSTSTLPPPLKTYLVCRFCRTTSTSAASSARSSSSCCRWARRPPRWCAAADADADADAAASSCRSTRSRSVATAARVVPRVCSTPLWGEGRRRGQGNGRWWRGGGGGGEGSGGGRQARPRQRQKKQTRKR